MFATLRQRTSMEKPISNQDTPFLNYRIYAPQRIALERTSRSMQKLLTLTCLNLMEPLLWQERSMLVQMVNL
jgi:hypothetical protein